MTPAQRLAIEADALSQQLLRAMVHEGCQDKPLAPLTVAYVMSERIVDVLRDDRPESAIDAEFRRSVAELEDLERRDLLTSEDVDLGADHFAGMAS